MEAAQLSAAKPAKTASEKPSALPGVHAERTRRKTADAKRKEAESKLAAAESIIASLTAQNAELVRAVQRLKVALETPRKQKTPGSILMDLTTGNQTS